MSSSKMGNTKLTLLWFFSFFYSLKNTYGRRLVVVQVCVSLVQNSENQLLFTTLLERQFKLIWKHLARTPEVTWDKSQSLLTDMRRSSRMQPGIPCPVFHASTTTASGPSLMRAPCTEKHVYMICVMPSHMKKHTPWNC